MQVGLRPARKSRRAGGESGSGSSGSGCSFRCTVCAGRLRRARVSEICDWITDGGGRMADGRLRREAAPAVRGYSLTERRRAEYLSDWATA